MSSTFELQGRGGWFDTTFTGLAVVLWLVVAHYAFFAQFFQQFDFIESYLPFLGLYPQAQFGIIFLGLALLLFVVKELGEEVEAEDWWHVGLLIVSGLIVAFTTGYMMINFRAMYATRIGTALTIEYIMALAFLAAMFYLVYRSFGLIFTGILAVGILYGLYGSYMPGVMWHTGLSSRRILQTLVTDINGFFGFLTRVVATWVALFLLYAGLLKGFGAFDLIFRMAIRTSRFVKSGVAQTAVVASAIIGSVNGSQTANSGMTGAFTIPLMQRNGIKGSTAGGIESTASTLGQVLPPVMGSAGFIMASLIGISYFDVILAGLLPAIILLIATAVAVHFIASPEIEPVDLDEVIEPMTRRKILIETIRFGIPMFVLLWLLGVWQWRVMSAAFWTVVAMLVTGIGFPLLEDAWHSEEKRAAIADSLKTSTNDSLVGVREGAVIVAPVTIILAAINGVADIFTTTGVPGTISLVLMDLSQGVLAFAVILTMIICIVLGLGMPTTASYTLVAILIAPALTGPQFEIADLSAHYFVFYAALLAGLTPPIATCPAVTSGIAGASFWTTSHRALKVAAPIFVIPFAFIYQPELVSGQFKATTFLVAFLVLSGAVILAYGINAPRGYPTLLEYALRSVYAVIGIAVIILPSYPIQFGLIGLALGVWLLQRQVLDGYVIERSTKTV